MPYAYFKTDTSEPVRCSFTADGRIDFSLLGRQFKLEPTSILLNGTAFPIEGLKSELKWEQIEKDFKTDEDPVGTKVDPVKVIGEAAVPAVSTGDSISGTTERCSRPDTLVVASGCTFLVGEDKKSSVSAAEDDLMKKMLPLSSKCYGEVECILGYIAAAAEFQWVCIDKSGRTTKAGPRLNLAILSHRCQFLLSVGYAHQLIGKMISSVPDVPGRLALFAEDVIGDRTICFYGDHVLKKIKNFASFCEDHATQIEWIRRAYTAGRICPYLPSLWRNEEVKVTNDTYKVKIQPIGYSPTLKDEEDTRMLAKNVCQALCVLRKVGLVHRDVRFPNILQVSKNRFILIDLETVAESPFREPPGFGRFNEWTDGTMEGSFYTPMSDLYQLGILLESRVPRSTTSSASAQHFISMLKSKQYDAATALNDLWLSNPA